MAYKIRLTTRAKTDLTTAFNYFEEKAPETAASWYRLVTAEIASLTEMAARCPLAPEAQKLGVELQHLLYGQRPSIYRIVFRVVEERQEVHVLTVRHGARKPLTDEDVQPFSELP